MKESLNGMEQSDLKLITASEIEPRETADATVTFTGNSQKHT